MQINLIFLTFTIHYFPLCIPVIQRYLLCHIYRTVDIILPTDIKHFQVDKFPISCSLAVLQTLSHSLFHASHTLSLSLPPLSYLTRRQICVRFPSRWGWVLTGQGWISPSCGVTSDPDLSTAGRRAPASWGLRGRNRHRRRRSGSSLAAPGPGLNSTRSAAGAHTHPGLLVSGFLQEGTE